MKILFVCKSNVSRSQIAEAIYNKLSGENLATSAGINPKENEGLKVKFADNVINCMEEIGFDLTDKISKKITEDMTKKVDKIVVIGEKNNWPDYLKTRENVTYWDIDDPGGHDLETFRKTRDQIKNKIEKMLNK